MTIYYYKRHRFYWFQLRGQYIIKSNKYKYLHFVTKLLEFNYKKMGWV